MIELLFAAIFCGFALTISIIRDAVLFKRELDSLHDDWCKEVEANIKRIELDEIK
ncbi:MAG: hypothetical protein ACN2B6_00295 [Rickettsiales bacterium]